MCTRLRPNKRIGEQTVKQQNSCSNVGKSEGVCGNGQGGSNAGLVRPPSISKPLSDLWERRFRSGIGLSFAGMFLGMMVGFTLVLARKSALWILIAAMLGMIPGTCLAIYAISRTEKSSEEIQ